MDMVAKKDARVSSIIVSKDRNMLGFEEQRAAQAADWLELSNALFGLGGKATEAFPSERERTAFCKTAEYKRLLLLMDRLPAPPVKELVELASSANGAISVRLPRS